MEPSKRSPASAQIVFIGIGTQSTLADPGQQAIATATKLAAWVPATALATGQSFTRLSGPPDLSTWESQLTELRGERLVYLAPGWNWADDPGVTVLETLLGKLPHVEPKHPPVWMDIEEPTIIGPAARSWRPDPSKSAIIRGIGNRKELDHWLDLIKCEFGLSARTEGRSWEAEVWSDAESLCDDSTYPATLRISATEDSTPRSVDRLRDIITRLRSPNGCPWDRKQTHRSLRPFLIEESHEAIAAIDTGHPADLAEELGDVLLQIALHAEIAHGSGDFGWPEIIEAITAKMIRRHPHVFGGATASSTADVRRIWGDLKRQELRDDRGALSGIPLSLPSLAYANAAVRRAKQLNLDLGLPTDAATAITQSLGSMASDLNGDNLGDALLALVERAENVGEDLEMLVRDANLRLRARLATVDQNG